MSNSANDTEVQSRLLVAVEKWVNDISFFAADEPNTSVERISGWQNLERILSSVEESIMHILIFKERHLIDTIVQHTSIAAYSANREVWYLAVKCATHCFRAVENKIWDAGEFSASDLVTYLMGVVEQILQERTGIERFKYAILSMELWSAIQVVEFITEEVYESFLTWLSQLLLQVADVAIYKQRLSSFVQRYLFSLASAGRDALIGMHFEAVGEKCQHPEHALVRLALPLGGSVQLLRTLCTHKSIVQHPLIVLSILRSHASLCCVPAVTTDAISTAHKGLKQQHEIIRDFLLHLQLCLVDGSLSLSAPSTLRTSLIVALCPLICTPHAQLRSTARRFMHIVVTEQRDFVEPTSTHHPPVAMRQVFPELRHIVQYGSALMGGIVQVLSDLEGDQLLRVDEESLRICEAIDETLELVLDHVLVRAMLYDATLVEVGQKLAEALIMCSKLTTRVKLLASLQVLLQQSANCNVRGCLPLLEANAQFRTAPHQHHQQQQQHQHQQEHQHQQQHQHKYEQQHLHQQQQQRATAAPPPALPPTSTYTSRSIQVIDLINTSNNSSSTTVPSTTTQTTTAQNNAAWAFLKPPTAPLKPPPGSGPLSKLISSVNANTKESALDRLARLEQEQLAQERRNLYHKRMYGDLDANPPPNSEDLMGKVGKYAKFSPDFGAHVGWLDAKGAAAEETSWQQQLRELRESKERARQQVEQKRAAAPVEQHNDHAESSRGRRGGVGEGTASRHRSSMLEVSDGIDEDAGAGAGEEANTSAGRKVVDWRTLLQMDVLPQPGHASTIATTTTSVPMNADVSGLMHMYTSGEMLSAAAKRNARAQPSFSEAMTAISIDPLVRLLLKCDLSTLCADARGGHAQRSVSDQLEPVPVRFLEEEHYISCFTPVLLAEVKSAVVSYINGDNTSDEARYSTDTAGSTRGGFNNTSSEPVRVRCLLRSDRPGQSKLQEALVVPLKDDKQQQHQQGRLNKDDVVLVMSTGAHADTTSLQQLVCRPHSLALVLSSNNRGDASCSDTCSNNNNSNSNSNSNREDKENRKQQSTLLMLAGAAPPQDTVRLVVPITSLTSFLREWSALMSIRNHRLMPLAPYLLKASPVVSSQHLSSIHDAVLVKLKALEVNPDQIMSLDRQARLNAALLEDLHQVLLLQVDGSVLKNTGIAKTIKSISTATSKLIAAECETISGQIIAKWKAQVKNDNRVSTIRNMKGGKLIEMPVDGNIERPRCVSPALWAHFVQSYNKSQLFAIKYVSDQFEGGQDTRIALVQGPPGTGKTFTVLGMVAALLNYYSEEAGASHPRKRLLICAPSNTAVDELLSRLSAGVADGSGTTRTLNIVRLGEPLEGASEVIKKLSLDAQIDARLKLDEAYLSLVRAKEQIVKLDRELLALPVTKFAQTASSDSTIPALSKEQQRARSLRTELATLRQTKVWAEQAVERARAALRQQILLEADVVGATLSGSGRKQFLDLALQNDVTFETAIVDEAAQATEPSCLIPLRLGCRRLVLVGDPRQLPATVLSKSAALAGLGRSLFERLERADHEVVMLTIQYRMHPDIRRFPSRYFYQNLLTDAAEARALTPITVVRDGKLTQLAPFRFLDLRIAGDTSAGKSYVNDAEISAITRLLCALLPNVRSSTVAVITPYKAQVGRIKRALREDSQLASHQNERRRNDAEIEVNSVDGFQGREKDIVIFSAVRSNMRHVNDSISSSSSSSAQRQQGVNATDTTADHRSGFSIGFVADERRLNVAITRAKRLLIVVGNAGTLATDITWRCLLQDSLERRQVVRVRRLDDLRADASVFDLLSDGV